MAGKVSKKGDPETIKTLTRAISEGKSRKAACELAGISQDTFARWLNDAEFADAIKVAEKSFEDWRMNGILEDARKSLKTLVCGQEYEEVKTEYENDGVGKPRIKRQTRITKKVLPNVTAVIFALCNTDPEHWRQRVEQDVRADVKTKEEPQPNKLAKVPTELLRQLCDAMDE